MATTEPSTRRRFGRYETLFRFASGGMAEVFAARATGAAGFERLVALKRILPSMNDDERIIDMFMDEGRLAASISSANVVSTLDLGRAEDGSFYIVMDLVIGAPLNRLLRNAVNARDGDPTPAVATEIIRQAARGLHDAHEACTAAGEPLQIIHRDVSPQNILVGVDGCVKITDFGVARATQRKTRTSTGEFKGKLSYFSPEQTANEPLDRRSDIFALGIVAWETLTGRRLFHADNPLAVLDRVMNMPIPPPHEVAPRVPADISDVVMGALARDPDDRPRTAAELATDLRAAALASLPPCSNDDLAGFVSTYGGEALESLRSGIKSALANPTPPDDEIVVVEPARRTSSWWARAGVVAGVSAGGAALAVALLTQRPAATAVRSPDHAREPAPAAEEGAPDSDGASPPPDADQAAEPAGSTEPASPTPTTGHAAPRPRGRATRGGRTGDQRSRRRSEAAAEPQRVDGPEEPGAAADEAQAASADTSEADDEPRLGTNRAPILR